MCLIILLLVWTAQLLLFNSSRRNKICLTEQFRVTAHFLVCSNVCTGIKVRASMSHATLSFLKAWLSPYMHFLSSEGHGNIKFSLWACPTVTMSAKPKLRSCVQVSICTQLMQQTCISEGKQYLSSMLAKHWLTDLHDILEHHDYKNAILAVHSKMQIFTTLPWFFPFSKEGGGGCHRRKEELQIFLGALSSSGSHYCSTKTLMFTRNSHDSAAPNCCLLFKTSFISMSEQRALTLKLPYKSGQANSSFYVSVSYDCHLE